jgi:hypothetical protein
VRPTAHPIQASDQSEVVAAVESGPGEGRGVVAAARLSFGGAPATVLYALIPIYAPIIIANSGMGGVACLALLSDRAMLRLLDYVAVISPRHHGRRHQ